MYIYTRDIDLFVVSTGPTTAQRTAPSIRDGMHG